MFPQLIVFACSHFQKMKKQIATNVENAMVHVFSGPSDKGVYSKSVQQTLYQMAGAALKAEGALSEVRFKPPFCCCFRVHSVHILRPLSLLSLPSLPCAYL